MTAYVEEDVRLEGHFSTDGGNTCIAALKISIVVSQKNGNQFTSTSCIITLGYIPKGCSIISQGHLLNDVHSSIICHPQDLETTKMPLNQRMDKENVVHLYNGVLLSCKNNYIMKF